MKVSFDPKIVHGTPADIFVAGVFKGKNFSEQSNELKDLDQAQRDLLSKTVEFESGKFKGNAGETLLVTMPTSQSAPTRKFILTGLGEEDNFSLDAVRKASASAIRLAKSEKAESVKTLVHGACLKTIDPYRIAQTITEVSNLAIYSFDKYKTKDHDKRHEIKHLILASSNQDHFDKINAGIQRGVMVSRAQSFARDWVNEPPVNKTPIILSEIAKKVARENDLEIEVLDKNKCLKHGMGSFLSVARGSDEPPMFIVIKYRPKHPPKKHIALIGKGVTFDSGGLDLKPASGMEDMKIDMAGAAAVIATMSTMKELEPDVAISMIVPATENMTGGKAIKPRDVVYAMDGTSIEIMNTDAEGRLILADAIAYAVNVLKVDEIIDLATLTGAIGVALGEAFTGVMTNNQEQADKIVKAGNEEGERMWQLPLCDDYRDAIKSEVADIKNLGDKGQAGAQAGAVFLEHFTEGKPWTHLDIASTAYISKANEYGPKGATGVGVRTLVNYLDNYV